MNTIDVILSIFLLFGFIRGFFKGFFVELAGLIALIAGIYGAIYFSDQTLVFLKSLFSWEEKYLLIVAFALTFFIIVLCITLIGRILTKMLSLLALGIVNKIAGAVFGLLKMAFFASLFFMFLNQSPAYNMGRETKENSVLYAPVREFAPLVLPSLLEKVKELDYINDSSEEKNKELYNPLKNS